MERRGLPKKLTDFLKEKDISFLQVFGSYAQGKKVYQDVDILVGNVRSLTLNERLDLTGLLESFFGKPVDLVESAYPLPATLFFEIRKCSTPLWRGPHGGQEAYIARMDTLHSIAEDEQLAYPAQRRKAAVARSAKRLGKKNVA